MSGVRICLSTPRSSSTSLETEIRAASEAGITALDLWAPKLDACLATYPTIWLAMHLREHRVYATAVSGRDLFSPATVEERSLDEARFLELCAHLDALGGGLVVVGTDMRRESAAAQHEALTIRALRGYANLAAPFEVQVALEYRSDGTCIEPAPSSGQAIVHRIARRNVSLALNTRELIKSGTPPEALDALDIGILALVRIESELHLDRQRAICRHLADRGFRGPYCIEWPSDPQGPQPDSLAESARQARQAALDLLAPLYG